MEELIKEFKATYKGGLWPKYFGELATGMAEAYNSLEQEERATPGGKLVREIAKLYHTLSLEE